MIKLLEYRPFKRNTFFKHKRIESFLKNVLINYLRLRERGKNFMSSCLSRSLLGRFLFDLFNIKNDLWFGILKNKKGKKIAHAWLHDPNLNLDITSSFIKIKGVSIFKI